MSERLTPEAQSSTPRFESTHNEASTPSEALREHIALLNEEIRQLKQRLNNQQASPEVLAPENDPVKIQEWIDEDSSKDEVERQTVERIDEALSTELAFLANLKGTPDEVTGFAAGYDLSETFSNYDLWMYANNKNEPVYKIPQGESRDLLYGVTVQRVGGNEVVLCPTKTPHPMAFIIPAQKMSSHVIELDEAQTAPPQ